MVVSHTSRSFELDEISCIWIESSGAANDWFSLSVAAFKWSGLGRVSRGSKLVLSLGLGTKFRSFRGKLVEVVAGLSLDVTEGSSGAQVTGGGFCMGAAFSSVDGWAFSVSGSMVVSKITLLSYVQRVPGGTYPFDCRVLPRLDSWSCPRPRSG